MKKDQNYPVLAFEALQDWEAWLEKHHSEVEGVWVKFAKKASGILSITHAEALDGALCYGWIDGQAAPYDGQHWLIKFTPRRPRSHWSQVNREKVLALQAAGRMRAAGMKQVELAQADGRWEAAYGRQSLASVPEDLLRALKQNLRAEEVFNTLNKSSRYGIILKVETARKPETRVARIQKIVAMLANNESPALAAQ